MTKRAWLIFIIVQIIGEIFYWIWPLIPAPVGMWFWGTQVVLLFPGNFASGEIVEAIFWNKITLTQMSIIEIPVTLAINALLWIISIYFLNKIKSFSKMKNGQAL